MPDYETRAVGGKDTRTAEPPLTDKELWSMPEGEHLSPREADLLMHSLQFRAKERIRLAKTDVERCKADLKDAKRRLKKEKARVGAFLSPEEPYDAVTMLEVWREEFPSRFSTLFEKS